MGCGAVVMALQNTQIECACKFPTKTINVTLIEEEGDFVPTFGKINAQTNWSFLILGR